MFVTAVGRSVRVAGRYVSSSRWMPSVSMLGFALKRHIQSSDAAFPASNRIPMNITVYCIDVHLHFASSQVRRRRASQSICHRPTLEASMQQVKLHNVTSIVMLTVSHHWNCTAGRVQEKKRDYYEVLGCPKTSSASDLKKAYYKVSCFR